MAIPYGSSPLMWKFYNDFKKECPRVKLGGIFAPKPGYHNLRSNLPSTDYSVGQYALDRKGPSNVSAAIDLTLPPADMHKYSLRLLKSGRDPKDPRGNYLREFYGNVGDDGYVDGWDYQAVSFCRSDSSHMWHIHLSFMRAYVNDPAAYRAVLSILKGESVRTWQLKEWALKVRSRFAGKPPASKPPALPKKPKAVYHTVRSGNTMVGIAAAYKTSLANLKKLNPKIKNLNVIDVGQKVRVK